MSKLVLPRRLSNWRAWNTAYVCCWTRTIQYTLAETHMGITLITHFTCSTCCILQSLHGLAADPSDFTWSSGVLIAALSRNLRKSLPWSVIADFVGHVN